MGWKCGEQPFSHHLPCWPLLSSPRPPRQCVSHSCLCLGYMWRYIREIPFSVTMLRSSQDGGRGRPRLPAYKTGIFFLKSLQNEMIWLPCYSLGACGIVEMPRRVGTPAASGPTVTAHFLAALSYVLSRWPFPLNLNPKNVVIWLPRALSVWPFLW